MALDCGERGESSEPRHISNRDDAIEAEAAEAHETLDTQRSGVHVTHDDGSAAQHFFGSAGSRKCCDRLFRGAWNFKRFEQESVASQNSSCCLPSTIATNVEVSTPVNKLRPPQYVLSLPRPLG